MKYTIKCQPIDIICNGQYQGNYILCEQVEVKKNKINIKKMNESCINYPDITGGYLLEIDAYAYLEKSKFISNKNNYVTIKYPKEKKIMPEQHMYIENKFNEIERKIYKGDLSKIDIDSFVKYFLIQELCAYWSVKMYKERNDEHLYFGPVWDFDTAFDNNALFVPINNYKKFLFDYANLIGGIGKLIEKILIDKDVTKKIKSLWKYVFENKLKDDYMNKKIDELVKTINESQRLNFIRWKILDKYFSYNNPVIRYTYENEIIFLKEFIKDRIEWMNNYILEDTLFDKYKSNKSEIIKIRYIIILLFIILF